MRKAIKPSTLTAIFIGKDRVEHARGEINAQIVSSSAGMTRNGRLYVFRTFSGSTATYEECDQFYVVTEF